MWYDLRMRTGRPSKFSETQLSEIYNDFEVYIDAEDDPTLPKFTSFYTKYRITPQYLIDRKDFSILVRRAVLKQEQYLINGGTTGKTNNIFSIFRLKQPQHGWSDHNSTDLTTKGDKIEAVHIFRPEKIKD
mgnify:CR=1 FL=1